MPNPVFLCGENIHDSELHLGLIPINLLSCTGTRRLNHAWSVGSNLLSKLAILRSCTSSDLRRRPRASCTSCVRWGVANLRGNSNQANVSGYEVCTHSLAGLMHGFSSGHVGIDTSTRNVPVGQRWTTNATRTSSSRNRSDRIINHEYQDRSSNICVYLRKRASHGCPICTEQTLAAAFATALGSLITYSI